MGRGRSMDEWVHCERQLEEGHVPNSAYWYVHCRHCADAYAQKQLVNPPSLIAGRRSAMHAHLKACPVYGARYKAEHSDAMKAQNHVNGSATRTDTSTADLDTDAVAATNKRKRKASACEGAAPRTRACSSTYSRVHACVSD